MTLPRITPWEQRAAIPEREQGDNALAQARMFEAVHKQRELVEQANARTKAARRHVQRRRDAVRGTLASSNLGRGFCGLLATRQSHRARRSGMTDVALEHLHTDRRQVLSGRGAGSSCQLKDQR